VACDGFPAEHRPYTSHEHPLSPRLGNPGAGARSDRICHNLTLSLADEVSCLAGREFVVGLVSSLVCGMLASPPETRRRAGRRSPLDRLKRFLLRRG
jgi:hypothetical protein